MLQNKIYEFQAKGIEGEYADDSPRREKGYILLANTIEGAPASANLAFSANPADNDTLTIGSIVYKFAITPAQANDIKIGTALSDTLTSLEKTINGEGEEGVNYFAGTTTPVAGISATLSGSNLKLTATQNGLSGNSIALASSDTNVVVTPFSGGNDSISYLPKFACAFSTSDKGDNYAKLGGEGVFRGILVNPKMYVDFMDLKPNLTLPDGTQGGLCTFGKIFIRLRNQYSIGSVAAYDKTTGIIDAYNSASLVPATSVLIKNAYFETSGEANTVGILVLGD